MTKTLLVLCSISLIALHGCKTGYNKNYKGSSDSIDPPKCNQSLSNELASANAQVVYKLLTNLTCDDKDTDDGALMGQSLGYGNQINESYIEPENNDTPINDNDKLIDRSYIRLVEIPTYKPAMISIGYETDQLYTLAELQAANNKLKTHWDAGGIVMIHWMPLNPWVNDASNIEDNRGSIDELAPPGDEDTPIDLNALLAGGTMRGTWLRKLDAMAEALIHLKDLQVPVLWSPLPAMNSADKYWWGLEASFDSEDINDASLYTNLWKDMYTYFTEEKKLNHLIWVYSPTEGEALPGEAAEQGAPVDWALPKDDDDNIVAVDVIGAMVHSNDLSIADYEALNDLGKPFGLARYNPVSSENMGGEASIPNHFDNLVYGDRLNGSYPNAGFWVSWHSYARTVGNDELKNFMALLDQKNYEGLAKRKNILDLETVVNENLRQ